MKKHLLIASLLALSCLSNGQQTYTWNVASGAWTTPSSWLPARTSPAPDDVLAFNMDATVTDLPGAESLGRFIVYNNAVITLSSSSAATLQIGHPSIAAPHLSVTGGATLNVAGSSAIIFELAGSSRGVIDGLIAVGGGQHMFSAGNSGTLSFNTGSIFIADKDFSGFPFGTTYINSVFFENGSRFISRDGSNPFGAAAPASVVVFQPGSTYEHQKTTAMSISGRTYGNVEFNVGANHVYSVTLGQNWVIQNDLILNNDDYSFNPASGNGELHIAGNIVLNGPGNLVLGTTTNNKVRLTGTNQQVGAGSGVGSVSIQHLVNSNSSTSLHRPLVITGSLSLESGLINTSSSALLSITAAATIETCDHSYTHLPYSNMGCNSSYIDGPIEKIGLISQTFAFPTGSNGVLRPVIIHQATGDYVAEYVRGNPQTEVGAAIAASIHHISGLEYWALTGTGSAEVELSFIDPNSGGVTDLNALKVARFNGSNWADEGTAGFLGSAGANGSVRSSLRTSLGFFTLAGSANYPNNPLPDKTYHWQALLKEDHVQLRWHVLNDRWYEQYIIEKSEDGQPFEQIATLYAQHLENYMYQYIEKKLPVTKTGYRLKMVTLDKQEEYSEIHYLYPNLYSSSLRVYPNPAQEKIFIKMPFSSSISELTIVNTSGSVVKRIKTSRQSQIFIDISTLSSGVYYIKFHSPTPVNTVKFIKF